MWNDLLQATVRNKWDHNIRNVSPMAKVSALAKKLPAPNPTANSAPLLHPVSHLKSRRYLANGKQQKLWSGRSPKIAATVTSYHEGAQHPCLPVSMKWQSGGILHVLALVDTGAEVTLIHSNINNK